MLSVCCFGFQPSGLLEGLQGTYPQDTLILVKVLRWSKRRQRAWQTQAEEQGYAARQPNVEMKSPKPSESFKQAIKLAREGPA